MDLSKEFRKAAAGVLAAVTMSGAAYAEEFGSNVRYVDEGQQVSQQEATAQQFPWSKDSRYLDQMQRARDIYDANLNRLDANIDAAELRCKTNTLNTGARQTNAGIVSHKKGNELGQIGAILGGVGTASKYAQCQAEVESRMVREKAKLDSSFIRQEASINRDFERQYQSKERQQEQKAQKARQQSGKAQKAAPVDHAGKVQQACEAAELRAINTGKDMNAVQKKMCKDILKP